MVLARWLMKVFRAMHQEKIVLSLRVEARTAEHDELLRGSVPPIVVERLPLLEGKAQERGDEAALKEARRCASL